jgi:hypothetical protein
MPATVNAVVGAAAAGGASVSADDTNGNAGATGGNSAFIRPMLAHLVQVEQMHQVLVDLV